MRRRAGFTLIEILIAMAILLILAGIAYPRVAQLGELAPSTTMAVVVRQIRERIQFHAAVADVPLSTEGYPQTVDPRWFAGGRLPADGWTASTLKVQVVHGPKAASFPNRKSFVVRPDGRPAGQTAWYNAANGSFCALVPRKGTTDEILAVFNRVNGATGDGDDDDDDDG